MDKRRMAGHGGAANRKYNDSHPDKLIELFSKGGGRETFCAELGISERTFTNWTKVHPEFHEAYEVAKQVGKDYYMKMAQANLITDKEAPFNDRLWSQIMRCRHELSQHNRIRIPGIKDAVTTKEKLDCIASHIAEGELSSSDIASLTKLLETCLKVSETASLEQRLEEIETKFFVDDSAS